MGNTYARLWAVVPDEKRYFSDPPFIKEFYTLVADFVQGFAVDFPEEASLKFLNPIQWNTLVYEDDLLSYKYRSLVDSEQETGYHKNAEIDGQILSDETFEDGVPHLKLTIDDQDRRLFSVWTIRQLANIIAVTEKTWDMEIASVLFFQPDPINHIFGNKYDTGSTQNEQKLDAVSRALQDMYNNSLETSPYQRLYMLLQQFDLLYLYRRLFMNFDDSSYLDPNLPYREISMLQEMAEYGEDAPLCGAGFLFNSGEWGWATPLHRQIYGDVAYVVVVTHDNFQHCLTVNVTGIYENQLLLNEDNYGTPTDSNIQTIVMWLKTNDRYFREHFGRASFRYDTRLAVTRERLTKKHTAIVNVPIHPKKFIAMDGNHKFFLLDHIETNPVIKRKAGFWLHLRQVHKNRHAANRVLYSTIQHRERLFKQSKTPDEVLEEEKRVRFLARAEVVPEGAGLEITNTAGILQLRNNDSEEEHFPESLPYDPKTRRDDGLAHVSPGEANGLPDFWPLFRIHRLMRFGCQDSVCAGALMVYKDDQLKESNAVIFHQFPIVEVALNLCDVSVKEYGRQKYEVLELLNRLTQCKFTLRQIKFFDGIKAISHALRSRYLEVKIAASVCLTNLMYMMPENQQLLGRDGGLQLLLQAMECGKVTARNYWFYDYYKKHQRRWPEEILVVASAQAAAAVWIALRDRRNRHDFVKSKGISACNDMLQNGKAPDYASLAATGILEELAHEREFHHQIVETGALKSVCKIMHHTNSEDVFQNAASIISLMCESDEGRETIRHSGGLLPLLKPLKTMSFWSNPGCTHAITEALYKTAISVLNCEVYRATKAVDMLLGKLYEGIGETLVFNILGFLSEMARLEQSRHFIRSSGVFPFIMDYMGHDNQYIRMKAAVATGRMGADKDSFNAIQENNGIFQIWNLMNAVYDPIVCVHACMGIYPLFVANPKETARIIRTIINPFGPMFTLFDTDDARVVDAVLSLTCLLAQDDDLLAMMSDLGYCPAVAKHIETKDVRLLRFVTEAVAVGSEYAINRINFSTTPVVPKIAKLLWHEDPEVQTNALAALQELTKYPQNIVQVHSDRLVRRLVGYLMEGTELRARKAAGCLQHMRYLAMANMGDTYNFEDTYFPLRSEEQKAISRTKRELLTKKLVPEAKAEADKMIGRVQNEKRVKMQFMPIPPVPFAPHVLEVDRMKLPDILRKSPHDSVCDSDVPPPPDSDAERNEIQQIHTRKEKRRDSTHVRNDKRDNSWRLIQAGPQKDLSDGGTKEPEWWMDQFDAENHRLFNRLTTKNNYLDDNVALDVVRARPYKRP